MSKATQPDKPLQMPDATDLVVAYLQKLQETGAARENWAPLLPFLFQLKGKPVTLNDYFPLMPLFNTKLPRETLYICGRQVAKSQSTCFGALLRGLAEPNYGILFVLPRFEMTRRFSANYVKPAITGSPLRGLFIDSNCENSVLQKTLPNGSRLFFSFAFLDCDRCRGLSVDEVDYDEVQDFDPSFIDIINETMSASDWRTIRYTGTPKTLDNTIEGLRQRSSMAELVTKCGCGHWCIPSTEYDAFGMIAGIDFILEHGTGLKCPACSRPVNPRNGRWIHRRRGKSFGWPGNIPRTAHCTWRPSAQSQTSPRRC